MLDWLIEQRIVIAIRFPVNRAERLRHGFRWAINSDQLKTCSFSACGRLFSVPGIAMWVARVALCRKSDGGNF